MGLTTILFIGLGLAMDAFAVSMASGVIIKKNRLHHALRFGLVFGIFQMMMPIVGYMAARSLESFISDYDHWLAFVLLVFIGVKMIYEALRFEEIESREREFSHLVLVGLAVATSIDALAIGVSFAALAVPIMMPVVVIGAVTFILSFSGIFIGNRFGTLFEKKVEILGGIILIIIGFAILLEHLQPCFS